MGHRRVIRYTLKPSRPQAELDSTPFHYYEFDDGTIWTEFHRAAAGYVLRFPGLADFEVSADGKAVVAYPVEEGDGVTVEHLYINQLVPLALSRQGRPAFHASAVTVPEEMYQSGLPRAAAIDTDINVILRRKHAAPFERPLELDAPGMNEDLKDAYSDQDLAN